MKKKRIYKKRKININKIIIEIEKVIEEPKNNKIVNIEEATEEN